MSRNARAVASRIIHLPLPRAGVRRLSRRRWALALIVPLAVSVLALATGMRSAVAAEAPVNLGTTASFAVLAGSTVTNSGPSVINGNLGLYPGSSITGFPPGKVNGTIHKTDVVAQQAQSDLTIAYNDAAGRGPGAAAGELGGRTLVPGVYTGTALTLTGTLTLDAQGDPNAVFIFQSASTLITAPNSSVVFINGAQACNVFWQVGSSATLGTNTTLVGTILALTSITAQTGATVQGRLLARNGAVTLDNNVITSPTCSTPTTTSSTTTSPTGTTTTAAVLVPGAAAPHTGDTGADRSAGPLNALLALGLFSAAGAIAVRMIRRTGRH